MKCDKLQRHSVRGEMYNGEEICGGFAYYDADDVDALLAEKDAAIAELKRKLMPCLNGDCILTCEVVEKYGKENAELKAEIESLKASHYAEMVDAGMRERRLHRELWLARANRAHAEAKYNHQTARRYEENKEHTIANCFDATVNKVAGSRPQVPSQGGGVQMSELKVYHCNEWHNEYTEFYLKSEVDALLAEKDAEIARLNDKALQYKVLDKEHCRDLNTQEKFFAAKISRLSRALYRVCAMWAQSEIRRRFGGYPHEENGWFKMKTKCLKKAEEYK